MTKKIIEVDLDCLLLEIPVSAKILSIVQMRKPTKYHSAMIAFEVYEGAETTRRHFREFARGESLPDLGKWEFVGTYTMQPLGAAVHIYEWVDILQYPDIVDRYQESVDYLRRVKEVA